MRHEDGFSLVEVMVVLAVMAMAVAVTVPWLTQTLRHAALHNAATGVGNMLLRCRVFAVFHRTATGLVFEERQDGGWRCFVAEDLDGDGISTADLRSGRDRLVGQVLELGNELAGLGILSTEPVPDPLGRGLLDGDLDDPIRAGRGNIITFTPRGTASPCSIYLTDHRSRMRVLRVIGATGRIRALEWRSGWSGWRRVLV